MLAKGGKAGTHRDLFSLKTLYILSWGLPLLHPSRKDSDLAGTLTSQRHRSRIILKFYYQVPLC